VDTPANKMDGDVAWNKDYKVQVDILRACCAAPESLLPSCFNYQPLAPAPAGQLEPLASHGNGPQLFASQNGTQLYAPEFVSVASNEPGSIHVIPPGTSLTLGWEAVGVPGVCTVVASTPPGIFVSGTNSQPVGTAKNWHLEDSPQRLGPFVAPGRYAFTIRCDDQLPRSLTFEVPGVPATFLNIQVIVGTKAGPAANTVDARAQTTVDARVTDSVYLSWLAENVQDGTCRQTETVTPAVALPAEASFDRSGFREILLHPNTRQTYSLTCLGNDGRTHTVTTTVRLGPA